MWIVSVDGLLLILTRKAVCRLRTFRPVTGIVQGTQWAVLRLRAQVACNKPPVQLPHTYCSTKQHHVPARKSVAQKGDNTSNKAANAWPNLGCAVRVTPSDFTAGIRTVWPMISEICLLSILTLKQRRNFWTICPIASPFNFRVLKFYQDVEQNVCIVILILKQYTETEQHRTPV